MFTPKASSEQKVTQN